MDNIIVSIYFRVSLLECSTVAYSLSFHGYKVYGCAILINHLCAYRWRMVIHGAVDGFSRIPVYLKCSDNNLAQTVLTLFKEAVQQYGLPSRVRCDRGVENVDVSFFLLSHPLHGPGRGSVLVGKSVHNQRVERMWRDVYQGVTGLYHSLFYHLENINLFNPDNELHLFCLHYVFIPRINRHLQLWSSAWIKHPMRSEHNLTPEQLWISGLQSIANCGSTVSKEVFEQLTEVGT